MLVTNAKYIKDEFSNEVCQIRCTRDGVDGSVSIDPDDCTYIEIMRQVEAGELTIQEADSE